MPDDYKRESVDYTETYQYVDVDAILYEEFGEPYKHYRELYAQSINYDTDGAIPKGPLTLDVELVNRCNLRCTMCYTDHHKDEKSVQELDTLRTMFRQLVQSGGNCLQLGMGSEITLYRDLPEVLKIAREEGVIDIWMFTNGILLTQELCDALVEYRVARLNISLDGATPETYHKVRGQDRYEQLEKNIDMLLETKERRGSKLPILRLTFVVQDQNIHEVDMFVEKWKDKAGYIDFQRYVSYEGLSDMPWGSDSIDAPVEPAAGSSYCPLPFNSLNVWANGDVTPCCFYFSPHGMVLGNIKEMSLTDIWKGEPLRKVREGLLSGNVNPSCGACIANRSQHEPLLERAGQAPRNVEE